MARLPTTEIGAHRAKMMEKYNLTMNEIEQYTHQSRQNICASTEKGYRTLEQNKEWFEVICAGVAHVKAARGYDSFTHIDVRELIMLNRPGGEKI